MYTVLILPPKTRESFNQFYPIFSEACDNDRIGVCQWVESGTTIETALPDIYDIISKKQTWRAMVVCVDPEEADGGMPSVPGNPFDYEVNRDRTEMELKGEEFVDSEVPLIRLAQLLGGIPAPEPRFEAKTVYKDGREPVVEYHRKEDKSTELARRAFDRWREKHVFHGQMPAEIVLLKMRRVSTAFDTYATVKDSWKLHMESDSSQFWRRNMYPHKSRFLVYDMRRRGDLGVMQDLFRMWTAVLLMAENDIDSDVLQVNRLYNLNVHIDNKAITESFQETINKLNLAKYQLQKSVSVKPVYDEDGALPQYHVGMPVSFQLPHSTALRFEDAKFGLVRSEIGDVRAWEDYISTSKSEMRTLLMSTDRTLDQTAERLRVQCAYEEEKVYPLSPYQEMDMDDALYDIYKDILQGQEQLPRSVSSFRSLFEDGDDEVRKQINRRMDGRQFLFGLLLSAGSIGLCLIPGIFQPQSHGFAMASLAVATGAIFLTAFGTLIYQRNVLLGAVRKYQSRFHKIHEELSRNATAYSGFLSNIASHIRGRSYMGIMRRKRARKTGTHYYAQKQLRIIDAFLDKLGTWSLAMHVNVDIKSIKAIELIEESTFDFEFEDLNSLSSGKRSLIPLNQSGINISSPFPFVSRLEIEREEVYDDA